jgi:polyvinyl alcohol dehydrogenase (cytochrome)
MKTSILLVLTLGLVPAVASGQANTMAFAGLFEQRCASCHENPKSEAPSRDTLQRMTADRVFAAVTKGPMAVNVRGLTDDQILTLVQGLTGRPVGMSGAISAASMKNRCAPGMTLADPWKGPSWNGWSPEEGSDNARFQPTAAAGLTADQVPGLKLKWVFGLPGSVTMWGQPTVAGGWVFIGSDNGAVYALDARTGCVHWSYEAKTAVRGSINIGAANGAPGVRYIAYFGDIWANVYAVDADTGKELWTRRVDDHKQARILAGLNLDRARGRLYVPVTSLEGMAAPNLSYECCKFRGSVVALDVRTGRQVWKSYGIPEPAQPLRKTTTGTQLYGPAGAAVWSPPTRDDRLGVLYFGTGNDYIYPATTFSDALFAVELSTGLLKWTRQIWPNDANDGGCGTTDEERRLNCPPDKFTKGINDDFVAAPILRTLGNGRRVVIGMLHSTQTMAFDPDRRGAVLWQRKIHELSPARGGFGPAADAEFMYVPFNSTDGKGGITAVRLATGEEAWSVIVPKPTDCGDAEWCNSGQGAAATAIPGVVFAGASDGMLRAYSTKDGRILWQYATRREFETVNGVAAKGGSLSGAPGPAIAGGLLLVGSGYGNLAGNALLAFGVD